MVGYMVTITIPVAVAPPLTLGLVQVIVITPRSKRNDLKQSSGQEVDLGRPALRCFGLFSEEKEGGEGSQYGVHVAALLGGPWKSVGRSHHRDDQSVTLATG